MKSKPAPNLLETISLFQMKQEVQERTLDGISIRAKNRVLRNEYDPSYRFINYGCSNTKPHNIDR